MKYRHLLSPEAQEALDHTNALLEKHIHPDYVEIVNAAFDALYREGRAQSAVEAAAIVNRHMDTLEKSLGPNKN